MTPAKQFWLGMTILALGCGGRTLIDNGDGVDDGSDGGDASLESDAPIESRDVGVPVADSPITVDSPIIVRDGPVTGSDSPIVVIDSPVMVGDGGHEVDSPISVPDTGTHDVVVPPFDVSPPPFDVIVPPPLDSPVTVEGGPPDTSMPDVSPPFDAGSDAGEPVFCGGEYCGPGQECCVGFGGGMVTASCETGGCDGGGISLSCTGSDNCTGGDVCCASFGGGSGSASCEPSCAPGQVQLCTVDGICPPYETCITSPFGLAFCRP